MAKFEKLKVLNNSERVLSNLAVRAEEALLKVKLQLEMIEGSVNNDTPDDELEDSNQNVLDL
jgi:hypothetical protein